MNSHQNKRNSKTFRNVFFNCHHFIRFRFVSFRISMVLDCVWVWVYMNWHCTIHETSEINRKKCYESGNRCMLTRTDSLHSYGCCYKWLFAKRRDNFGLWKLSLKKNHIEWNVSNLKFKWKRFGNPKNKWEGIFHVLNSFQGSREKLHIIPNESFIRMNKYKVDLWNLPINKASWHRIRFNEWPLQKLFE